MSCSVCMLDLVWMCEQMQASQTRGVRHAQTVKSAFHLQTRQRLWRCEVELIFPETAIGARQAGAQRHSTQTKLTFRASAAHSIEA